MIPRPTRSHYLSGGLFVSLALNVFLASIVIGGMVRPAPPGPGPLGQFGPFRATVLALPPDQRQLFTVALDRHRRKIVIGREDIRDAEGRVGDAMAAEPFNPDALAAAFAALRDATAAVQAEIQAAATDAIAQLPPDARHKVADFRGPPKPP